MTGPLLLSIDQGTSNTKAIIVDPSGRVIDRASAAVQRRYPLPGWVEQDGSELWQSVLASLARLDSGLLAGIGHIAIANQRESVLLWDRATGAPLGPVVGWQCQRGAAVCDELNAEGRGSTVRSATGLPLDPAFSASKAVWLLHQERGLIERAREGSVCFGTIDSWLLWNLTGGQSHGTEPSNASRTLLFNIHKLDWDDDLLSVFGIPRAALPAVSPSSGLHGETAGAGPLREGIPIRAMLGDSHAALYGQTRGRTGEAKASYGTGTSVMTATPEPREHLDGLLVTVAWMTDELTYALEGNILSTGASVQWAADLLRLPGGAAEVARLAQSPRQADRVYLVPAFVGLGTPHLDSSVRGLLTGLTLGTDHREVARAAVESIAYQVRDVVDALNDRFDVPVEALWADGGATANDWLMQFQADIIARPVLRSSTAEIAAFGVAQMAGAAAGLWESHEELPNKFDCFEPQMEDSERDDLYGGWLRAVQQAKFRHGIPSRAAD